MFFVFFLLSHDAMLQSRCIFLFKTGASASQKRDPVPCSEPTLDESFSFRGSRSLDRIDGNQLNSEQSIHRFPESSGIRLELVIHNLPRF